MNLHHVIEGPDDAPVLILSPSLGSDLAMWAPQAAALQDRFRVVRYDHRGHGGSPLADGPYDLDALGGDLLALLDELDVGRAHLCGLSLGGMTAMWVAAHAPERVERLVLCCTSAQLGPPETWIDRARLVRAEGTQAVAQPVVERWLTPAYRDAHPDEVAQLESMVAATPPQGYANACGVIERMNLLPDLGAIEAPTLVIAGAQDPATPPEHARRIAAGVDDARLEVLDPAAHLASWERADDVTALIREHLEA